MASPAAQRYFSSFPAGQQAQIRDSWGGADLMDEWFQNAVKAGTVKPDGTRVEGEGASTPTGATGGMTAARLRQYAKEKGWSEDFERFDDATLQGWINKYWDPKAQKFKSMRGAEGFYDKPTECPPGMGPSGPNETDPCVSYSPQAQAPAPGAQAAPGAPGGAQVAGGPGWPGYSPLRDMLANQGGYLRGFDANPGDGKAGIRGGVLGGGGIWYDTIKSGPPMMTPGGNPRPGSAPVMTPGGNPANPLAPVAPGDRGLGMTPRAQPGLLTGNPLTQAMAPLQGSTGLTGSLLQPKTGQLTNILQPYQARRKQQSGWF